jgi:putative lipoic acid-binding regulatory protein
MSTPDDEKPDGTKPDAHRPDGTKPDDAAPISPLDDIAHKSPKEISTDPVGSVIAYPLDFPIKIMGKRVDSFAQTVTAIVKQHAPDWDESTLEMRSSRENTYLSITVTIVATSREQLDALYTALSSHPMVSYVL